MSKSITKNTIGFQCCLRSSKGGALGMMGRNEIPCLKPGT
jgi:hypothetical protein